MVSDSYKQLLVEELKAGIAEVTFEKKNGELRKMKCTLNSSLIPNGDETKEKREKKNNPDVIAVYDTENNGWRSFRWDSLKTD